MPGSETIKTALERNARAVELRPSVGQGTAVTKVRLKDGLACDVEDGPWKFAVGMTEKYGGSNAGPNPGSSAAGRSVRVSRSATRCGRRASASRSTSLQVEVQADYDVRGELAVSEASDRAISRCATL